MKITHEDLERLAAEESEYWEHVTNDEEIDYDRVFERLGIDYKSCFPYFTELAAETYNDMARMPPVERVVLLQATLMSLFIFGLLAGRQYRKEVVAPTSRRTEKPQRDDSAEGPTDLEAH